MSITALLSEYLGVAADGIHAVSTSTTALTGPVDLSKYRQVMFLIDVGVMGTSSTVDFAVQGATASAGSYATITGTSITQLTELGFNGGQYVMVIVRVDQVQALNLGYLFIKGLITVATAASLVSVTVLGSDAAYEPAADSAKLVQTVVL